jgi:hypothetical protein
MVSGDGRWRVEAVEGGLRLTELVDGQEHVRFAATVPKVIQAYLGPETFAHLVDEEDPDCE